MRSKKLLLRITFFTSCLPVTALTSEPSTSRFVVVSCGCGCSVSIWVMLLGVIFGLGRVFATPRAFKKWDSSSRNRCMDGSVRITTHLYAFATSFSYSCPGCCLRICLSNQMIIWVRAEIARCVCWVGVGCLNSRLWGNLSSSIGHLNTDNG